MPGIDFRAARARLPLVEVLYLIGFEPRSRRGPQLRGPCPVHRSRRLTSRSFAAHLDKGAWHCFVCGAGGNALDLWVAVSKQDLHAAVRDLCARSGRDVPWLAPPARPPVRSQSMGDLTMPDP